jgi:hypothetical protein
MLLKRKSKVNLCAVLDKRAARLEKVEVKLTDIYVSTNIFGEFDSGSERTLAAWIRHASRTGLLV